MHSNRYGRRLAAVLPLALAANMALAETEKFASAPIDELKQTYLACDRAASRQLLDAATAAHCSFVGEALQKRAFEGSFDRLLAWWRAEKDVASAQLTDGR